MGEVEKNLGEVQRSSSRLPKTLACEDDDSHGKLGLLQNGAKSTT